MAIGRYDYEGLLNAFLYQHEPNGSTAEDRMSFSGNTLYSYSSILAEFRTYPKSQRTVLFIDKGTAKYSVTTAKHTNLMLELNSHPVQYWYIKQSTEYNLLAIMEHIDELLIKHKRARFLKPYVATDILETYANLMMLLDEYSIDKCTLIYEQAMKYPFIFFANKIMKD